MPPASFDRNPAYAPARTSSTSFDLHTFLRLLARTECTRTCPSHPVPVSCAFSALSNSNYTHSVEIGRRIHACEQCLTPRAERNAPARKQYQHFRSPKETLRPRALRRRTHTLTGMPSLVGELPPRPPSALPRCHAPLRVPVQCQTVHGNMPSHQARFWPVDT